MSFYITVKSARLENRKYKRNENVAIVITSENNRLMTYFTPYKQNIEWQDSFVAESSERQLEFTLIKQKIPGKTAQWVSSNSVSLSKYLFWNKDGIDEIALYDSKGKYTDTLILQICYRENKHFIGPIEFYRRGSDEVQNEDGQNVVQIQGDKSNFGFWKLFGLNGKDKPSKNSQNDNKCNLIGGTGFQEQNNIIDKKRRMEDMKFYKGPHKNRNIFSFCDQVYDDQKFTVVENYYNDQIQSSSEK